MSKVAYLFVDQQAFERLAIQPENAAGDRDVTMSGYEAYIIEQWACERRPNMIAATFTGNDRNHVQVNVLLVPENTDDWGPVTLAYFEELVRMHMLPKETPMGRMLVINISSLSSHLTLVSLPEDFATGRHWFVVNENLRRLACMGRTSVTAVAPGDSVIANFRQMFKIDMAASPGFAVLELVTLLQIALYYFGCLQPQYCDGLLCDNTLKALDEWWRSFGKFRYGKKPVSSDKMYSAISVAALIGTVTGARQRLSALKFKPPKDPFDAEQFVVSVKRFQKSERLPKTMLLDETTFRRLLQLTAKLSGEGGTDILTVMKSTMKEGLSGKLTSVMNDWETTSIGVLARNVRGERSCYLWLGRGHQRTVEPNDGRTGALTAIPLQSLNEGSEEATSRHHSIVHRFRKGRGTSSQLGVMAAPDSSTGGVFPPSLQPSTPMPHQRAYSGHSRNNSDWFFNATSPEHAQNPVRSRTLSPDIPNTVETSSESEREQRADLALGKFERMMLVRDDLYLVKPRAEAATYDGRTPSPSAEENDTLQRIKRSRSMSEIDKIVFPWTPLCSKPKILQLYEEARSLKTQLSKNMTIEADQCEVLVKRITSQDSRLDAEQRSHALIRFQVHASVRKEQAVKRRLRELEAFMARLEYEYVSLETKLKDVESSVEVFSSKVKTLEDRYRETSKSHRSWLPTILGF